MRSHNGHLIASCMYISDMCFFSLTLLHWQICFMILSHWSPMYVTNTFAFVYLLTQHFAKYLIIRYQKLTKIQDILWWLFLYYYTYTICIYIYIFMMFIYSHGKLKYVNTYYLLISSCLVSLFLWKTIEHNIWILEYFQDLKVSMNIIHIIPLSRYSPFMMVTF